MEEELKPCPYCGDAMPTVSRVGRCYTVECGCGMTGPYGDGPAEVVAIWNSLPRRSDIERVERERDWLLYFLEVQKICCFTEDAAKYCRSHDNDNLCDECPYMGREAWLKAIKEATCPQI